MLVYITTKYLCSLDRTLCIELELSAMAKVAEKEIDVALPPYFYLFKDGSVLRKDNELVVPPSPEAGSDGVASKDVVLNSDLGLWARIFLSPLPHSQKVPLVLHFHGGGFIFGSPSWSDYHLICKDTAKQSGSICVSASYRLAPEHRLPAALDDGFAALQWLHSQALLQSEGKDELMDPWLRQADFSKLFVASESAGCVLAHHVVMRAFNKPFSSASWDPMCIKGLILKHPFFMQGTRTQEEIDSPQDEFMNWGYADVCFDLILPVGSSKDNSYMNPLPAISTPGFYFPKTLVALADYDALHFMGLKYVRALQDVGIHVDMVMAHGVGHVFFIPQPDSEQAQALMQSITKFITG